MEVKAPRIFVEGALDSGKGVIGEVVGAEEDLVPVALAEGAVVLVAVGPAEPVELPLGLGKSTLKRCQLNWSAKIMCMVEKSLLVNDMNNAICNKNVGYDHFGVIDEHISILDRDLDGLALKGFDHTTILEVGAVQRLARSHDYG